ncbi:MAG: molybdopterin-synthase adenylyltransferase MoeB [Flavobacteriales bacterium]|nr:molybdopterin-synthase adenylyltransferase MoeB [Flavobacteriales bacterium]
MSNFTKPELERYSRHLIIPQFGMEGQSRLKASRVLVVGTGGLGAPLLQYLTAAGIGTIGIVDFDIVEDSNLQRQVLFSTEDIGRPKVEAAAQRLKAQNPHVKFTLYNQRLTSENAMEIIKDYDIVADGTDNFPTRYLVNDACVKLGKVNVYASIFRFEGQVSVFNHKDPNGVYGPNFRDLFPSPPPPGLVPSCAEGGVIGVLPGIIGSLQANEVIKVASGVGEPLSGRLFTIDASAFETRIFNLAKNPDHQIRTENADEIELIDYEQFCGIGVVEEQQDEEVVKSITVSELKQKLDQQEDFQIIDVREPYEYEIVNIKGDLIPKNSVLDHVERFDTERPVIVHCRSGKRSADVIRLLEEKYGYSNLYNLEGGILAYAEEIDQNLAKY